jgi:hypothetical protein
VSDLLHDAVKRYIDLGLRPIRVKPFGKMPFSKAWQNSEPAVHEFQPGENVGIDLGRSGDLVDIDLDTPQARVLAQSPLFFALLPAFGRSGEVPGHRLVRCPDAPKKRVTFDLSKAVESAALEALGQSKAMILELRTKGAQTVFPPSVYVREDGGRQELVWVAGSDVEGAPTITWDELRPKLGLLAFLALVASVYPQQGTRDQICLHLAGALVHAGINPGEADALVIEVAKTAGDEEADRRGGKAAQAAQKLASGEHVTGLPTLLAELGLTACEKRIRSWLGLADASVGGDFVAPVGAIIANRPDIHGLVSEFAALLREKSGRVYRRGFELVRLSTLEDEERVDGVVRRAGLVELRAADANWLVHEASRCGGVFVHSAKNPVPVAPPSRAAVVLSSVADESNFPQVRGIAMTPTLTRDEPGYDPVAKILLAFPPDMFPPAPPDPTKEDAEAALARLEHPLRGFPFVDEAAKAVAMSAMLSAVVRSELATCPMHVFDAPAAGSGKSKLADMVGVLATGVAPSAVTFSSDKEENEKRLSTILRCGDPVILVDNVSGEMEGDFLCQMLTQENVQARILGASERVRLSTRTLVLATGNNMRFRGDISRRVVVCRIDAKMSNPEDRTFDFDPVEEVKAARASLVVDALTILRAYRAAGEPAQLKAYGNFDSWSLVRGALVWLGKADPVETKLKAFVENPDVEERSEILAAFLHHLGLEKRRTLGQLEAGDEEYSALRWCLRRLTNHREWNSKAVGQLLRKHRDIPLLGVTLRSKENSQKVQTWWLSGVPEKALQDRLLAPPENDEVKEFPF